MTKGKLAQGCPAVHAGRIYGRDEHRRLRRMVVTRARVAPGYAAGVEVDDACLSPKDGRIAVSAV